MKEVIYITGVSKGLGKSLAEQFLRNGHQVVGIGRSHAIEHERFEFIYCDLRSQEDVKSIRFDSDKPAILVNNAGLIGPLDRFLDAPIESSTDVIEVNLIAIMNLCHSFLRNVTEKRTVINISSGAATRSISGWAAYCASKAAVDRFSETVQNEINENGQAHRIFAVSPGVIDTPMQEAIRSAQKNQFSSVETFRLLQENNELQSPDDVGQKLAYLALNPEKFDVVLAVRDIQLNA